MKKILTSWLSLMILLILSVVPVFASGIIIPRPHRELPVPPYLSVRHYRVNVSIDNQVAATEVEQVFENPTRFELEGDYIFPLPEDAAISSFQMEMDGKMVEGKVLDRDSARKIYEDIVRQRKDPGLLEYMGRNLYRARVFPIPARGTQRIRLKFTQTLQADNGIVRYQYPLDTKHSSSRPLKEVTLVTKVTSKVPVKSFYSPSHNMSVTRVDEHTVKGSFELSNVKLDKDFVLFYTLSEKDFGLNMLTYREKGEKEGYFLMFISPRESVSVQDVLPKDVVFVLDRSGSMDDEDKMSNAHKTLKFCLSNLNRSDNFNIVQFSDEIESFSGSLVPATPANVAKAREYTEGIRPLGGTNIRDALLRGFNSFKGSTNPRYLIFITDGLPTVGVTDVDTIIRDVKQGNEGKIRLYTFGVGSDVNTRLLDKLASDSRGFAEYVKSGDEMELKVSSFYRKISEPLLSDVGLKVGSVEIASVYPRVLPDIFRGSQLIVVGKYKGSGASAIHLSGKRGRGVLNTTYEDTFPQASEKNDFIPRLWALRRIGYLLEEIRTSGDKEELVNEVVKLSRTFGIITPYTSFLVEEPGPVDRPRDASRVLPAPVVSSASAPQRGQFKRAYEEQTGAGAVAASKEIASYQQADSESDSAMPGKREERVKYVEGKTFYLRDGVWVDSEYEGSEKVTRIKFSSDEYFKLASDRKLSRYLAVGELVLVKYQGVVYLVEK